MTTKEPIESWRKVWRDGFVPILSTAALTALREALLSDDPRLVQGATTVPPPMQCVQDWPAEGACLVAFGGWQGEHLETVGEVEEFFARCCFEADQRIGEPAACRHLLNFFDDRPRPEAIRELLAEVDRVLMDRAGFDPDDARAELDAERGYEQILEDERNGIVAQVSPDCPF